MKTWEFKHPDGGTIRILEKKYFEVWFDGLNFWGEYDSFVQAMERIMEKIKNEND